MHSVADAVDCRCQKVSSVKLPFSRTASFFHELHLQSCCALLLVLIASMRRMREMLWKKSGIIGAQLQMLILNCMREKRQGGINGMLDRVIRFFRFDRRNGEYELLETEEGTPGYLAGEEQTSVLPQKEDTRKICATLAENEACLRVAFRGGHQP